MTREFFYIENVEDEWSKPIISKIDNAEHNQLFHFSLSNLQTTEHASERNVTDQSDVLAPNNSTESAKKSLDGDNDEDDNDPGVTKQSCWDDVSRLMVDKKII